MQLIDDLIPVFGTPDPGSVEQIRRCRWKMATHAAMMADHHKGYAVPIGGVVAYKDAVSPSGVGYDIACGNMAVRTDASWKDVTKNIEWIMDDVFSSISFGVGRRNETERVDHALFDDDRWKLKPAAQLKEMARQQLGTVGSGNHYVDIFLEDCPDPKIWVGVHFGSRGFGHKTATYFLRRGGQSDEMNADPYVLHANEHDFENYIQLMGLAGEYAYAGREWVIGKVLEILGARATFSVHNHHNFAWKETHGGEDLWVVRKGATPAFPGQKSFIGGSMGDVSVIVEGQEHELNKHTLNSTVHGAGRVTGRLEAKGKWDKANSCWKREPRVHRGEMLEWIGRMNVELRGAGVDESPQCYKRLPEVLAEHEGTIKVLHTLVPIGVAMAGEGEFDPYKD